jgi:hypothetical protein
VDAINVCGVTRTKIYALGITCRLRAAFRVCVGSQAVGKSVWLGLSNSAAPPCVAGMSSCPALPPHFLGGWFLHFHVQKEKEILARMINADKTSSST